MPTMPWMAVPCPVEIPTLVEAESKSTFLSLALTETERASAEAAVITKDANFSDIDLHLIWDYQHNISP